MENPWGIASVIEAAALTPMLQTTNHKRPRRNMAIIAEYSLSVGLLRFTRSAATPHIAP